MLAWGETPASVLLLTFRISTEAPTPTKPPAAAPATPKTDRTSFARTFTCRPATTEVGKAALESIVAVVPPVGTLLTAFVATLPPTLPAAEFNLVCALESAELMRELVLLCESAFAHS